MADATTTPAVDAATRSAEIRSAVLPSRIGSPLASPSCGSAARCSGSERSSCSRVRAQAGPPVILYCELTGLRYQTAEQAFVSRLSSRVELVRPRDARQSLGPIAGEAEDHCRSRRRDYYVNYRITLPSTLAPGDYRLRLIQTDLVAGQSASAELPVTIPN